MVITVHRSSSSSDSDSVLVSTSTSTSIVLVSVDLMNSKCTCLTEIAPMISQIWNFFWVLASSLARRRRQQIENICHQFAKWVLDFLELTVIYLRLSISSAFLTLHSIYFQLENKQFNCFTFVLVLYFFEAKLNLNQSSYWSPSSLPITHLSRAIRAIIAEIHRFDELFDLLTALQTLSAWVWKIESAITFLHHIIQRILEFFLALWLSMSRLVLIKLSLILIVAVVLDELVVTHQF